MKEFKKIKGKYQGKVCYKIEEIWHKRFHKNDSIISLEGFPDFVRLGKDVIEFKEHGYPKGGRSRFHADIDTMLRLHRDDDVRSRLALVICGMALDAISLNSKIADASIVKALQMTIQKIYEDKPVAVARTKKVNDNELVTSDFLKEFENTNWQCYERKDTKQGDNWGIAVSILKIGNSQSGDFIRLYDKIAKPTKPTYTGTGHYLSHSSYLEIRLVSKEVPGKINFLLLKIGEKPIEQSVLIGFSLKFSRSYNRYLTKTVYLKKKDINHKYKPHEVQESDNNLIPYTLFEKTSSEESVNYSVPDKSKEVEVEEEKVEKKKVPLEEIDLEIRQFLWNRRRNRMSMPADISNANPNDNESSIQHWQEKRFQETMSEDLLTTLVRKFLVVYQGYNGVETKPASAQKLRKEVQYDSLELRKNPVSMIFEASYKHSITNSPGDVTVMEFVGKARRSGTNAQIILEQKKSNKPHEGILTGTSTQGNYILINFSIWEPVTHDTVIEGLLTRIVDDRTGPACYRCFLVVDKRKNGSESSDESCVPKMIKSFLQGTENSLTMSVPIKKRTF
ncbi:hypothetical protein ON006_29640 [Dyadobacter pollutisoli]|uniref:Uncharacterized protein n=2 Tax=Dyadobacter pollutisoli TaxID=2910158 RepID=A0A9E8SLK2_9BACT|nr:hypothetical protein [Dyadobacter pollutisoli]WAC11881.1 hypothetical protein ON006_29640 [Dyadobacter pollutisoli]